MSSLAKLIVDWALSIAIGNTRDRVAPRTEGNWPSPRRLAVVAFAAVAIETVVVFVEKAFAKPTKPEKIPVSI